MWICLLNREEEWKRSIFDLYFSSYVFTTIVQELHFENKYIFIPGGYRYSTRSFNCKKMYVLYKKNSLKQSDCGL